MLSISEKVGHLDIEASNLKAPWGLMLSYCIKMDGGDIIGRYITGKELKDKIYDKELLKELVENLRKFDKITTYYGGDFRFDLPFIRSRCLAYGISFPEHKELKSVDVYSICKKKLCMHSNRLQAVCDFLNIPSKNHPITSEKWIGALSGDDSCLKYIFEHNKEDVVSLEQLYHKMVDFVGVQNQSI